MGLLNERSSRCPFAVVVDSIDTACPSRYRKWLHLQKVTYLFYFFFVPWNNVKLSCAALEEVGKHPQTDNTVNNLVFLRQLILLAFMLLDP